MRIHCHYGSSPVSASVNRAAWKDWIGLYSVLRPRQHSIGYMGDGFYRFDWLIEHGLTSAPTQYRLYGQWSLQVKRPNQQYQSTEGDATKEKAKNENN